MFEAPASVPQSKKTAERWFSEVYPGNQSDQACISQLLH
jgi:hypothetical protein